ncbi:hypothetical protein FHW66_004246 [Herbaspirillum sp. Sphag64]|uniref:M23 family metallopeptidase n=1 Tax=Herbaspirillum sp. Sphag64 TaxID=2587029 RepID=UPI00161ACC65|nr:M23 family metallopeptidase [Herbaspirillum sp. Sphag64]MBB3248118.1 hypothetical protein [Herbaspirillum sp. Sphag64]
MIISPPFILPVVKEDDQLRVKGRSTATPRLTDDEITENAMCPTASIMIGGTGAEDGTFPVASHLMWHNGIHLQAKDAGSHDYPVHAIADGEVVFRCKPTRFTEDRQHGQQYQDGWTDNGCVILKHTTEIGADGDQPVSITCYSVYMHLVRILITAGVGEKVYRKDKLGVAGQVYGHTKQLHFEICCDTENLKKIIGREPGWLDPEAIPTKDGRTDSIFGSLYIYLPATTPISLKAPTDHLRAETDITLGTAQWIKLDYGNEGKTPGSCAFTSYGINGQLGATRQDADAEYNLYKEATDRHNSLIKAHPAVKSSPSGWYELLRFGRNIGRSETDKDSLPDDAAHWRKIRTLEGKSVWADLNAPGTYKFSDADFLPQFGWNCYDDDTSPNDQRCDSERLKALIRAEGDQPNPDRNKDDVNLSRRLGDKDVRKAMRRAICKFPCEWDKHAMVERYEWLKEVGYGYKDNPEGWAEYVNHLRAMTFDGLPQEYTDAQWRFHPTEFIKHFRKCGWLSGDEMIQLFPMTAMREHNHQWVSEKVIIRQTLVNQYCTELNKSTRRYCIVTPSRLAAFYGNATQETMWFGKLYEANKAARYAPWDGRGFLQLTWPDNYIKYWEFTGKIIADSLKIQLNKAAKQANLQKSNVPLSDELFNLPVHILKWRDVEILSLYSVADSAGAYWAWTQAALLADRYAPNERAKKIVNGKPKIYYTNNSFGNVAGTVNVGMPTTSYTSVNGIVARFQAYTAAQIVLLDKSTFPDANGNLNYDPDDFTPRRP